VPRTSKKKLINIAVPSQVIRITYSQLFTMSAQVYADKWDWLSKQSNWRRILHESGITKIKRDWCVEQAICEIRNEHPHTFLPWNDECLCIMKLEKLIDAQKRALKASRDLCDSYRTEYKIITKENEELKKENEELKREIKELRFPDGC